MTGSTRHAGTRAAPRLSRTAARQARRRRARRRQQLFGAAVVIVLLIGGGGYAAVAGARGGGGPATQAGNKTRDQHADTDQLLASDGFLLDAAGARRLSAGPWAVASTSEGSRTPERSFTCQAQRFADTAGVRTWVRQFKTTSPKVSAVQYVELSSDTDGARRAFETIVSWISSCSTPQQRLVGSYGAAGLGDRAVVAVLAQPAGTGVQRYRTLTVAGTGPATMVFEYSTVTARQPSTAEAVAAAGDALRRLCTETKSTCPWSLALKPNLLASADEPPGFLSPIDLPVVGSIDEPWVGVEAGRIAGTDCQELRQKVNAVTTKARTYLAVGAKVPTEFGLDTIVLNFDSAQPASTFVNGAQATVDRCKASNSNVKIRRTLAVRQAGGITGQTWEIRHELEGGGTLTYRVGVARAGSRAVYLLFPVLKGLDLPDRDFADVVARAAQRAYAYR